MIIMILMTIIIITSAADWLGPGTVGVVIRGQRRMLTFNTSLSSIQMSNNFDKLVYV